MQENTTNFSVRIKKDMLDQFKKKTQGNGQSMSAMLKIFINLYNQDKIKIENNRIWVKDNQDN